MFNETTLKVIVVAAVVAIVELVKKYIFKEDVKYKLIYTFAPVVLCAVAFIVIALIQKTDVGAAIAIGASLGLTAMGSYDAIAAVLRSWQTKSPSEIVDDIDKIISKNKSEQ